MCVVNLQSALVGSYSSTKSPYMYCNVNADLPTPPEPTMMTLCRGNVCFALVFAMDTSLQGKRKRDKERESKKSKREGNGCSSNPHSKIRRLNSVLPSFLVSLLSSGCT